MKKLQILGTGCPKCKKLAENADAPVEYKRVRSTSTDVDEGVSPPASASNRNKQRP